VAVLEFDSECCIGQVFLDLPLHFDHVFLRHRSYLAEKPAPLKLAFFRRLSY
jgi:hypothetical protein